MKGTVVTAIFASAAIIASTFLLSSCGAGGCTPNIVSGLNLSINNADTGEPAGCGATVDILYEDGTIESIPLQESPCNADQSPLQLLDERPGTYQVTVTKEGYAEWVSDVFEVRSIPGDCHVETVFLDAQLEPLDDGPRRHDAIINHDNILCPAVGYQSSLDEESLEVINDTERFTELYFASDTNLSNEIPTVDFDESTIIAIHLGFKPSLGYQVQVRDVTESASHINVNYVVESPSEGCEVDLAISYPYCFMAIDKTDKEVLFNATQETRCP